MEVPDWELGETVTPSPHHPIGAKGVGRVGHRRLAAGDRQRRDRRAARAVRRRPHRHAVHARAGVGGDAGKGGAAAVIGPSPGRARAAAARRRARRSCTATVVRAQRPTSVRAGRRGARARRRHDRGLRRRRLRRGQSVRLHALRVLETGEPLLLRHRPRRRATSAAVEEGAVTVAQPVPERRRARDLPRAAAAGAARGRRRRDAGRAGARRARPRASASRSRPARAQPGDDAAVVVASHGRDEEARSRRALTRRRRPTSALVAAARAARRCARALDAPDALRARLRTPGRARHRRAHAGGDRAVDPGRDRRSERRAPRRRAPVAASTRSAGGRAATRLPRQPWRATCTRGPSSPASCLAAGGSRAARPAEAAAALRRRRRCSTTCSAPRGPAASTSCSCALGGARGRGARAASTCAAPRSSSTAGYGEGCSSSIAARWRALDPRADVLVLLLGDQPGVTPGDGARAAGRPRRRRAGRLPLRRRARAPVRVRARGLRRPRRAARRQGASGSCSTPRRRRGRGADRPGRSRSTSTPGTDYEAVLRASAVSAGRAEPARRAAVPTSRRSPRGSPRVDYLADEGLATALFLALRLPQPLLLEGEAGVGKTEAAKALAAALDTPLIRLQCYEGIDAAEALYEWNYPRQLLRIRLAEAAGGELGRGRALRPTSTSSRRPLLRGDRAPGPAAGRAADRRARPRRRRLRGVPARAAGRGQP